MRPLFRHAVPAASAVSIALVLLLISACAPGSDTALVKLTGEFFSALERSDGDALAKLFVGPLSVPDAAAKAHGADRIPLTYHIKKIEKTGSANAAVEVETKKGGIKGSLLLKAVKKEDVWLIEDVIVDKILIDSVLDFRQK
jgi:hypothetical protein